ncbi:hypothetical protein B0H13DRAFT_2376437 [Mycena leptocephala]|nr:hypothetical protein B0H13DRAFT_2376437 [Mycena leptocephala]
MSHRARNPKYEILHSGTWWKDFHRARARRKERSEQQQTNAGRLDSMASTHEAGSIYTFTAGRSMPIVGTVQNNGTILNQVPDNAAPTSTVAPLTVYGASGSPHTPLLGGPGPSKKAQAIMQRIRQQRPIPDPDEALLAQLQKSLRTQEKKRKAPSRSKVTMIISVKTA